MAELSKTEITIIIKEITIIVIINVTENGCGATVIHNLHTVLYKLYSV